MSTTLSKHPAKSFALSALALGMGIQSANALDIQIVNMLFDSSFNAEGNINFDNATGRFTSIDLFFNQNWTADVQAVFTTPGQHVWTDNMGPTNAPDDDIPIGNYTYTFTLAPGQVAAGTYFNWNNNNDIPVLTIFDCGNPDNGCVAAGPGDAFGNNIGGVPMQVGPFVGSAPAFNDATGGTNGNGQPVPGAPPVVLAGDRSLSAGVGVPTNWVPNLNGSVATRQCTITQAPTLGVATVQSNCSGGTYTASGAGSDSFIYQVTSTFGGEVTAVDTGTVSVTNTAGNVPPTADDFSATTTVSTPVDLDILANASAAGGALDPASVMVTQQPIEGTATVNTATGMVTYQPNTGYCGPDRLTYTVDNTLGATSNPGVVSINISANVLCNSSGATISAGSVNPGGNGEVSSSEILSAGIPVDKGVISMCVGGCFDYVLTGVTGPTATLILPLSEPMPAAPKLRKWDGSEWGNFVVQGADVMASAKTVGGLCPGSGYTSGLTAGNDCVRVTISDGGPNDTDGQVNGQIVDPSGVGKDNIPAADPGLGSGCTLGAPYGVSRHFDWTLLFAFVGGLWYRRKRRQKLHSA